MRRKRKKIILALTAAIIAAAAAVGVSTAYLSDADTAVNEITIGSVTTSITENFPSPGAPKSGGVYEKNVSIKNTGPDDCYVRVQVTVSDSDMESLCEFDYNSSEWEFKDGWWYYKSVLKNGQVTESLFTKVGIAASADEDMLHAFEIYVRQESRQSEGYTSCFEPWE